MSGGGVRTLAMNRCVTDKNELFSLSFEITIITWLFSNSISSSHPISSAKSGEKEITEVAIAGEFGNNQSNSCAIENAKNNIVDSRTAVILCFSEFII